MIRSIARIAAPLVAAAALIHTSSAWASTDPFAGVEQAIEAARVQWKAPGFAVAIVKDDRIVLAKGFGTRRLGKDEPVDEHTLFTLASTTKAFTATAIGILVDDGKLDWDDPVVRRVPEFRVADPYVTREATIRDLLAHRTGVEEMDILWARGFDTATTLAHARHARQSSSFRSNWGYNNVLYVLAAEIVARTSGMSFEQFVAQRIFAPLGMKDSTFTRPELRARKDLTGAHLIEQNGTREIEPWLSVSPLGAAGIQSSAADMAQWLRMLLNEGSVAGRAIVKPQTLAETLKPQMLLQKINYPVTAELAKPHFFAYGLGWFVQDYKGRRLAMHTGSLYGANALVAIVPEERLGLAILVNASTVDYRHALMYDVVDRSLGVRERDWNAAVAQLHSQASAEAKRERTKALQSKQSGAPPSGPLADYTAVYSNPLGGDVEVLLKDGRLALVMQPLAAFSLTHWSYDTFEASDDRAPEDERFHLTFVRGVDGKVSGYELPNGRSYRRKAAPQR